MMGVALISALVVALVLAVVGMYMLLKGAPDD